MMPDKIRKYYLSTLGCAKNEVDSEALEVDLVSAGLVATDRIDLADLLLVNSCGFIVDAKVEAIETALALHNARKKESILVMCGCLPARYDLREAFGEVDLFLPSDKHAQLVPYLKKIGWADDSLDGTIKRVRPGKPYGYLKISEGCDNRCSYCAIPAIKGPYISRPVEQIVSEAEFLCENSVKELVLIGQDTTLYGKDLGLKDGLLELTDRLVGIRKVEWLRIMYAHPAHFPDSLTDALRSNGKIVNYIDLPLQHINDRILTRMNRKIDRCGVVSLIDRLRCAIPDLVLRTTFMVGFPGESDREFEELLDFCEEVQFDNLGIFRYSPEEGTPSAGFKDRVDAPVIEERYLTLLDLQNKISKAKLENRIGQIERILIQGDEQRNGAVGRAWFQAPEVDGVTYVENCKASPGDMMPVRITGAESYDLFASPVEEG